MPKFVITYRRPSNEGPSMENGDAWMKWFQDIRENVVEMGAPTGSVRRLGDVHGDQSVSGYTILSAADIDQAAELTKGCPGLALGYGLEIGELLEVPALA